MNTGQRASEQAGRSGWFATLVELIKATAWPVSILLIFFFIKGPLLLTLSEIPNLVRSAQNVTVGSISINLRTAGIPSDVRRGLSKLSRKGLVLFLSTGTKAFGYLGADWESQDLDADAYKELAADGLMVISPSGPGEAYPIKYALSPGARNAYEVLLAYIVAQLAEPPATGSK